MTFRWFGEDPSGGQAGRPGKSERLPFPCTYYHINCLLNDFGRIPAASLLGNPNDCLSPLNPFCWVFFRCPIYFFRSAPWLGSACFTCLLLGFCSRWWDWPMQQALDASRELLHPSYLWQAPCVDLGCLKRWFLKPIWIVCIWIHPAQDWFLKDSVLKFLCVLPCCKTFKNIVRWLCRLPGCSTRDFASASLRTWMPPQIIEK